MIRFINFLPHYYLEYPANFPRSASRHCVARQSFVTHKKAIAARCTNTFVYFSQNFKSSKIKLTLQIVTNRYLMHDRNSYYSPIIRFILIQLILSKTFEFNLIEVAVRCLRNHRIKVHRSYLHIVQYISDIHLICIMKRLRADHGLIIIEL